VPYSLHDYGTISKRQLGINHLDLRAASILPRANDIGVDSYTVNRQVMALNFNETAEPMKRSPRFFRDAERHPTKAIKLAD